MSNTLVPLIMDVVVLAFLGATIFYIMRLTKSLSEFKTHRRAFDGVIADLLAAIDQAERSVTTLKQVSAKEAGELDSLIMQSKALADDLKIINEAGESMAKRLENLAEKNRKIVQSSHENADDFYQGRSKAEPPKNEQKISSPVHERGRADDYRSTLKRVQKDDVTNKEDIPSFMIKDRDFDDVEALEKKLDSFVSNDIASGDDEDMPENLRSQAERELFEALRNTRKNIGGGRKN